MCDEFGEGNIGSYVEMNPMVQRILDECEAKDFRKGNRTAYMQNSKYDEFVKAVCEGADMVTVPEEHRDKMVRLALSPKEFFEHMRSFAVGMQYAAKKLGVPVQVDEYEFHSAIRDGTTGKDFRDFNAAALHNDETNHYTLLINPEFIMRSAMMERAKTSVGHKRVSGDEFTPKEKEIMIGAEEMLHFYDMQHNGAKPTYTIGDFNVEQ